MAAAMAAGTNRSRRQSHACRCSCRPLRKPVVLSLQAMPASFMVVRCQDEKLLFSKILCWHVHLLISLICSCSSAGRVEATLKSLAAEGAMCLRTIPRSFCRVGTPIWWRLRHALVLERHGCRFLIYFSILESLPIETLSLGRKPSIDF